MDTLQELKEAFNAWENIVDYTYLRADRMCNIYQLVIKTKYGKHYMAEVLDDGESCCSDFEELVWQEVELKEVVVKQWKPL